MDIQKRVQDFKAVQIKTVRHGIDPIALRESDVQTINQLVAPMMSDLAAQKCDIECVYGTELCRAMEAQRPGELIAPLRALSTEQEAAAAWGAAFFCLDSDEETQPLTVIDLGNGSTQVARGHWTGSKIASLKTASAPVGSSLLMNRYSQDGASFVQFAKTQVSLMKKALHQADIGQERSGLLYLAGGVATKIGWLNVRRDADEFYKPERVNGVAVRQKVLDESFAIMHGEYVRNPANVVSFVDPREGSEREALRVISGAPYLAALVHDLQTMPTPRITGYGVRHGIAFLLLHGLLE